MHFCGASRRDSPDKVPRLHRRIVTFMDEIVLRAIILYNSTTLKCLKTREVTGDLIEISPRSVFSEYRDAEIMINKYFSLAINILCDFTKLPTRLDSR